MNVTNNNNESVWDNAPRVTPLVNGGYALTWWSYVDQLGNYDIYTAVYGSDGQPVGGTSIVNVTGTLDVRDSDPRIAALSGGGYAMVWQGTDIDSGATEIHTAVFGADGQPLPGSSIFIASSPLGGSTAAVPEIAALSDGGYALAWYNNTAVYTAVFGADGLPKAGTTTVSVSGGAGTHPQLAALQGGGYAITWKDNAAGDVFAAVYSADGQPLTDAVNVSNLPEGTSQRLQIVALSDGGYALSWAVVASGNEWDIYTAAFDADGQPVDESNVLSVTNSIGLQELDPRMTALADGAYALTWYAQPTTPDPSDPTIELYTAVFQVVPDNAAPTITSNGAGDTALLSIPENTLAVTDVDATDPDAGDTLTYSIVPVAEGGGADAARFAIDSETGALSFIAAPDYENPADTGADNVYDVTVQVSDGNGGTDTQAIAVTVTNANEAPTGAPTAILANGTEDQPYIVTASNLLAGFSDVDGDTLSATNLSASTGTVADNGDGTFTIKQGANFNGAVTLTYDVIDGNGGALPGQTLGYTVVAVNDGPSIAIEHEPDIVTANYWSSNVAVLLGDGSGSFTTSTTGLVGGSQPSSVALGDINSDGMTDIVVVNQATSNVGVLFGDGIGGFTESPPVLDGPSGISNPSFVTLADVDGNSSLDVIVANDGPVGTVSVRRDDGNNTFSAATVSTGGGHPTSLATGDIDRDGDVDIVVTNSATNTVGILLGDGAGGFTTTTVGIGGGTTPFSVALGDLNGDGWLDIATANQGTTQVSVLLSNGSGGFTAQTVETGSFDTYSVAIGDVNGDSHLDVVTANRISSNVSILTGDGTGNFVATTTGIGAAANPWVAALADLDGDGDLDIATTNQGSDSISILINDSAGNFVVSSVVASGGDNPVPLAIGDVDNAEVTAEDASLVFSSTSGNRITLSDVDAGAGGSTLDLAVEFGTLSVAGTPGLVVTGDGTSFVSLSGTVSAINAALDGLTYVPSANFNGTDHLEITVEDNGNSGSGGNLTASRIVPIIVTAENDAPSFAVDDGKITTPIGTGDDFGRGLTLQPDGKIVVSGTTFNGSSFDFAVVRYNADGTLDTSFGTGGSVVTSFGALDDHGFSVAIDGDGRILVAGYASSEDGTGPDYAVVRYNSDGSPDTTFDGDGRVTTALTTSIFSSGDIGQSIVIQPDGKILVAGHSLSVGGNFDFSLASYNTDGSLDTSFSGDGKLTTDISGTHDASYSVALQPDGKIVAVGHSGGGANNFTVVRYNSDGSLDTSFAGGIVVTDFGGSDDVGQSVVIQPDGKIVVAGYSSNGSDFDLAVARYNPEGSLDTTFDTDGWTRTDFASGNDFGTTIVLQGDGKILVAGNSFNGTNTDFALVRYNIDGSLDTTFGSGGKVTTEIGALNDEGFSVVVQADGKILVSGYSHNGTDADFALLRYNADGSVDTTFGTPSVMTISIGENTTAVATIAATDPDAGDTLTYSIVGGADAALFAIDANTGTLSFIAAPDFEAPADAGADNIYDITVEVSDGNGGTDTQAIAVTVTDVAGVTITGNNSANTVNATTTIAGQPLPTDEEDTIIGNGGADNLSGLGGNDTMIGGAGNDALLGGSGNDAFEYTFGHGADVVDGGEDVDTLIITGLVGNDTLNVLFNGTALTSFEGGSVTNVERVTADLLGGTNTLTYAGAGTTSGVAVDLAAGTASGFVSVANIANVTGASGSDSLKGNGGANSLSGGAGNDILEGSGGNDALVGGTGSDTASYASETDAVFVSLSAGTARRGAADAPIEDTLTSIENVTGGAGADEIVGNGGVNTLQGGDGDDTIVGGGGADLLSGGSGNDHIFYTIGDGADQVDGGDGTDTLTLQGTTANNTLDVVFDGATLTKVEGGAVTAIENVHADLGAGTDTLSYAGSSGAVTVDLTAAIASGFTAISGIENVVGSSGNDILVGAAGVVNRLTGGAGDDTFTVHDTADVVSEASGGGVDAVLSLADAYSLSANIENLTYIGTGNFSGSGNGANNIITGGSGNDTLSGGSGSDTLIGGIGNDVMNGGTGNDAFIFAPGFGNDSVSGFDANPTGGQDLLDLSAFGITGDDFDARVSIVDVGADTLVTIDNDPSQTILLSGIGNASTMTFDDFRL